MGEQRISSFKLASRAGRRKTRRRGEGEPVDRRRVGQEKLKDRKGITQVKGGKETGEQGPREGLGGGSI